MGDGPTLLVSGGGSFSVSTDALLADAERLRSLAIALPIVALDVASAATLSGSAESVALSSWRLRGADAAVSAAHHDLVEAIRECDRIADALDSAAVAYGRAEQEAMARVIAIAEQVAARSGSFIGEAVEHNPGLAWLLAMIAGARTRDLYGDTLGPADIEVSPEFNRVLSDPRVVAMLRSLVMSGDDFVGGVVHIPAGLGERTSDVGLSAMALLALGAMSGLFAGAPVTAKPYGSARPSTAAATVADRAARIPNAVSGEVPQVRIERYTGPGLPDRFEVYIGGTVDFSPVAKEEPFDLTSNLQLEAGLPAGAYEGVREAMTAAGITESSPVVFTGHSQGGLVASRLASSGEYAVEALVTFGAPAGQVDIPTSVPALIVENLDDVVPALGGVQRNSGALLVSARAFADGGPPPSHALPAHRIEAYLATAEAIDVGAQSGAVVAFRDRLAGLTSGYEEVSSQRYLVTRAAS